MTTARHMPGRFVIYSTLCVLVFTFGGCAAPLQSDRLLHANTPRFFHPQAELVDVPFFPQERYQCGPAALAMVLDSSGLTLTAEDLVPEVYLPKRAGSLQAEMLAAARRHERIPYVIAPEMEDLLTEVQAGHPVLVLQNLGLSWLPQWHYAVVIGYDLDDQSIVLHSGVEARRVTAMHVFERTWRRGGYWGVVVMPPGELPATADETQWLQSVATMERLNAWNTAGSAYAAALKRWPHSKIAALGLGNTRYALGDLSGAESVYRELIRQHPDAADGYNNLALVLNELDRLEEAEQAARQAIALDGAMRPSYEATLREIMAARARRLNQTEPNSDDR